VLQSQTKEQNLEYYLNMKEKISVGKLKNEEKYDFLRFF
jgi:hypothetical protein